MDRTIQPDIKELKDFSISVPVRTVLSNGVPLTIINAGEQEVVRVDILFKGGRWHQTQLLQALFTNRMLREGTGRFTAATIAEKLDYYGSWLELSSSSEYSFLTLYSLNKYIAETLDLIESIIKEPTFPEKELKTVLDTNIQQYQVNSTKVDFLANRGLHHALYGSGHPCGQFATEEDYRAITPGVIKRFYEQYYHSGNCAIFLSGKVTNDVIHRITEAFGDPFGFCSQQTSGLKYTFNTISDKRIFIEREDALQSSVKLGCTTITRFHPDYLKFRVLMTLFGGYFGSRLMTNIREEKGYTYGISAGIMPYPDTAMMAVSTETDNEYVEALIAEVYHEIDKLHQEPISVDELKIVRNYMLGEMCRSYESPFSLADAWIFIYTSGMSDDYFTRSLQALNEVTPCEIQELACRYLCKETLKEVISGKKLL